MLAYENPGEWALIASSQLTEKTNCVSAEQNWMHVEKQYLLKSTINCAMNPPAFKQACNIINLLFLLVSKVLNSPVVSCTQRYHLNSTLEFMSPAGEVQAHPRLKLQADELCHISTCTAALEKNNPKALEGQGESNPYPGLGNGERRGWQGPQSRQWFLEALR